MCLAVNFLFPYSKGIPLMCFLVYYLVQKLKDQGEVVYLKESIHTVNEVKRLYD
jgi:hypothetical protein